MQGNTENRLAATSVPARPQGRNLSRFGSVSRFRYALGTVPAVPGRHRGSPHDRDLSRGVPGRSRRTVRITPPLAELAGGAQGAWLVRDRALLAWVGQTGHRFPDHSRHATAAGSHRTNGPRGRASAEVPFRRDSRKPDPPQRRRFPGHAALDVRTLSIIRVRVRRSTQYPLAS